MYETTKNNDFYQESDFIISVPLNIIRKIKRGYNQSDEHAERVDAVVTISSINNMFLPIILSLFFTKNEFFIFSKRSALDNLN